MDVDSDEFDDAKSNIDALSDDDIFHDTLEEVVADVEFSTARTHLTFNSTMGGDCSTNVNMMPLPEGSESLHGKTGGLIKTGLGSKNEISSGSSGNPMYFQIVHNSGEISNNAVENFLLEELSKSTRSVPKYLDDSSCSEINNVIDEMIEQVINHERKDVPVENDSSPNLENLLLSDNGSSEIISNSIEELTTINYNLFRTQTLNSTGIMENIAGAKQNCVENSDMTQSSSFSYTDFHLQLSGENSDKSVTNVTTNLCDLGTDCVRDSTENETNLILEMQRREVTIPSSNNSLDLVNGSASRSRTERNKIIPNIELFDGNKSVHLVTDYIAFNCRTEIPNVQNYVHFLTFINKHATTRNQILHECVKQVYTTSFNVWYLKTHFGMKDVTFITANEGQECRVTSTKKKFSFTFLNSNYRPGSIVVLLEGEFGTYLYANNCRFNPFMLLQNPLLSFSQGTSGGKTLDKLYLDGTYYLCPCTIPSRDEILESLINLIWSNNDKIVNITTSILGYEEILSRLAKALNKKIYVSPLKMEILSRLNLAKYFTTDITTTNIRTIPTGDFQIKKSIWRDNSGPFITIILSAHYVIHNRAISTLEKFGIHHFLYTDHSSNSDIVKMLKLMKVNNVIVLNSTLNLPLAGLQHELVEKRKLKTFQTKLETDEHKAKYIMKLDEYSVWFNAMHKKEKSQKISKRKMNLLSGKLKWINDNI
ncbi:uncharacterized protein LOC106665421 [Cimex lectularius]|uniref:Uncharacterized protein n=1 Tax=Cimex lectularius TaxID=79782 RepID=A0A8I6TDM9_CIMLE|nr:uncharacterized protein LOC106665421 [Cimex lectularius]